MGALVGIAAGILAAAPLALALRSGRPHMAAGLAAVLASFLLFHVAAVLARQTDPGSLAPFAATSALAFLGAVVAAAVRRD